MVSELTTDQKGAIAESAIVHAAIKLGIGVYKPLHEGRRYDLISRGRVDKLLRVQCEWTPRHERRRCRALLLPSPRARRTQTSRILGK